MIPITGMNVGWTDGAKTLMTGFPFVKYSPVR